MNHFQASYFKVPIYKVESIQQQNITPSNNGSKLYTKGILSSAFPRPWDSGLTGKGIKVAVIDTGIDGNHPDLRGKVIQSVNFTNEGLVDSHGTHVAGTIGANGWLMGGAYDAQLIDIKCITKAGANIDVIMRGITYAADNGAKIINMSAGGMGLSGFDINRLNSVVQYAWNKGAICIAASGNAGKTVNTIDPYAYPASANNVKSIASCDVGVNLNSIELNAFSNENNRVSLTACGSQVFSTIIGGKYGVYSGTSMATPHVSAMAAVLAQSIYSSGSSFSQSLVNALSGCILPINRGLKSNNANDSYGAGFLRYNPNDGPVIMGSPYYNNTIFIGYTK